MKDVKAQFSDIFHPVVKRVCQHVPRRTGKGRSAAGISDLRVEDRLRRYMVGGHDEHRAASSATRASALSSRSTANAMMRTLQFLGSPS